MSQKTERQTNRPLVLACVIMGMFMVAIEATVVATAMPSIAGQLGGFTLYSWVFTAFLLTQAATTVVFGKLADLYGRRPVFMIGLLIFGAGSILCGFAWSIGSLIVFRLLQGLGAGSILPVVLTIVGDLYTPKERAGVQGWLSGVWGVSAVLGPLVGGLIVEHFSWPWVFWMNLPLIALCIGGLMAFLHEDTPHRSHALDLAGTGLFFVAITAVCVVLTRGVQAGGLPWIIGGGAVFLVAAPLFLRQERRHPEPMMDLSLWMRPFMAACNSATFFGGMTFMGMTTLLPIYVQGVMGGSATKAGLAIGAMSFGWPLASLLARRFYVLIGGEWTCRLGGGLIVAGCAAMLLLTPVLPFPVLVAASFVLGAGMGLLTNVCTVLIQSSVGWAERGAATSSNAFSRTLGNMTGAALLGGVLNAALLVFAGRNRVGVEQVRHLLEPHAGQAGGNLPLVRHVLDSGLHVTFLAVALLAACALICCWRVPAKNVDLT